MQQIPELQFSLSWVMTAVSELQYDKYICDFLQLEPGTKDGGQTVWRY